MLDFEKDTPIAVVPMSSNEFFVDGDDHMRLVEGHALNRLVIQMRNDVIDHDASLGGRRVTPTGE